MTRPPIEAIVFDCYGTLLDFDDAGFERAYGLICQEQGLDVSGKQMYDIWMAIWRRNAASQEAAEVTENEPGPLSETDNSLAPRGARLGGSWMRSLEGPPPPFRHYRDEWPQHFAICFDELGLKGDAEAASARLRVLLSEASIYPEVPAVLEELARRYPIAAMSNADNDFLLPCLERNRLHFPVVITSEDVHAYKPHVSIFNAVSEAIAVAPAGILYVGDSRTADVIGARHAGMYAAWVNRSGQPYHAANGQTRMYEPDFELADLTGLLRITDATKY